MKKGLVFCFIWFALASTTFAAQREWKKIGPPGGTVYEITPDRSNPNLWYSIVNETLYRSSDNAHSWKKIAETARTLAVSAKDSSLYVITGRAERIISKSVDHGETFTVLGTQPPSSTSLKLDQNIPGLMYSNDNNLFRSSNDGKTWEEFPIEFSANSTFYGCTNEFYLVDILPSPIHAETLYASVELSKCPIVNHQRVRASLVLESADRGTTWHLAFARNSEPYYFSFDSAHPDHAFAFNKREIEIPSASGWSSLSKIPCAARYCSSLQLVETIAKPVHLLLQQRLYTKGTRVRLLLSENGGKTWSEQSIPISESLRKISSMAVPQDGLVAGTQNGGIYRKAINQKWTSSNVGVQSRIVFSNVLASGNKIYAYQQDLFARSDDRGEHWKDLFAMVPSGHIVSVAVNPQDGNHVILSSEHGFTGTSRTNLNFYVSMDGGEHWKLSLMYTGRGWYPDGRILFHPVQANIVFMHVGHGVYKSVEFGLRPFLLNLNGIFPIVDLVADINNPQTIYLTDGDEVFKSNDGGINFKNTGTIPIEDEGDGAAYICQAGTKLGTFLVDNDNMAVLITTNGGERWKYFSKVPAGRSGGNDPPGAGKLISVDSAGMHFFAESHGGFFESINGAISWRRLNHEWPVEKRLKDSVYSSDFAFSKNGPLIVATNWGLFKAITSQK